MNDPTIHFIRKISSFVPEEAVSYCGHLWKKYPFHLKITRPRKSKLGDYRYIPNKKQHYISINCNLNRYAFLVTYIHEVAHLITFQKYGRNASPHGKEWKAVFGHLLEPVVRRKMVPRDILKALQNYMQNPKASSCSDPVLTKALGKYDSHEKIYLSDIPRGELFTFQERIFKRGNLRRTRYECAEVRTGKKYLISKNAEVTHAQERLI